MLRNGKALQWGLYRIQLLNLIVQGKLLQWRIQLSNPLVGGKAHSPTNGHQPQSKSTTTLGYHRRWSAVVVLGVVVVVVVEIVVVVLGVILVLPGKLYHQELDCSHFVKDRIYFFSISSKPPITKFITDGYKVQDTGYYYQKQQSSVWHFVKDRWCFVERRTRGLFTSYSSVVSALHWYYSFAITSLARGIISLARSITLLARGITSLARSITPLDRRITRSTVASPGASPSSSVVLLHQEYQQESLNHLNSDIHLSWGWIELNGWCCSVTGTELHFESRWPSVTLSVMGCEMLWQSHPAAGDTHHSPSRPGVTIVNSHRAQIRLKLCLVWGTGFNFGYSVGEEGVRLKLSSQNCACLILKLRLGGRSTIFWLPATNVHLLAKNLKQEL